jgi:hypothetical protein
VAQAVINDLRAAVEQTDDHHQDEDDHWLDDLTDPEGSTT